jgi:ankyrin repeat protein
MLEIKSRSEVEKMPVRSIKILLLYVIVVCFLSTVTTNAAQSSTGAESPNGTTELMEAVENNDDSKVTADPINGGEGVNAKDNNGFTALIRATLFNGNPDVITALIKSGADVKAKDKDGKTAADYAEGNDKIKNSAAVRRLRELTKK